jgi:hypothetical protein
MNPTDDIVGKVTSPLTGAYKTIGPGGGIILFFTNILRLVFVVAGIYAFLNFILAGFQYMTAAGDGKALSAAWDRIWQSMLGLIIVIASFALTPVISQHIFGDPTIILHPQIYGPTP